MRKRNPLNEENIPAMGVMGKVSGIFFNGHDAEDEDASLQWWSSDISHVAYFGDLSATRYEGPAFIVNAEIHPEIAGLQGYEADNALEQVLDESGAWVCAVLHWEGEGVVLLAPRGLKPNEQLLELLLSSDDMPEVMPTHFEFKAKEG